MSWDKIKGNEKIKDFLKNAIASNKAAHAYLFCGPSGIGKFLFAKEFAKELVGRDVENHPDVLFIAPDKPGAEIKIAEIRRLQSKVYLKPYEAQCRVVIINDAQNLNEESSNALLKVLEEPPQHSILILISTSADRVLPTIASRCQIVKFSILGVKMVEEILEEEHGLSKDKAHYLASMAQGRLGAAILLKDKEILEYRDSVLDWFVNPDKEKGFELENMDRDTQKNAMDIIASWYRDVLFYKIDSGSDIIMNVDRKKEIARWANKVSFRDLERSIESIFDGTSALSANANPKVVVSVLMGNLAKV